MFEKHIPTLGGVLPVRKSQVDSGQWTVDRVALDIRSHASTWTAIKSFPYEGKGDRSAVDEVTCRPAPLREAL